MCGTQWHHNCVITQLSSARCVKIWTECASGSSIRVLVIIELIAMQKFAVSPQLVEFHFCTQSKHCLKCVSGIYISECIWSLFWCSFAVLFHSFVPWLTKRNTLIIANLCDHFLDAFLHSLFLRCLWWARQLTHWYWKEHCSTVHHWSHADAHIDILTEPPIVVLWLRHASKLPKRACAFNRTALFFGCCVTYQQVTHTCATHSTSMLVSVFQGTLGQTRFFIKKCSSIRTFLCFSLDMRRTPLRTFFQLHKKSHRYCCLRCLVHTSLHCYCEYSVSDKWRAYGSASLLPYKVFLRWRRAHVFGLLYRHRTWVFVRAETYQHKSHTPAHRLQNLHSFNNCTLICASKIYISTSAMHFDCYSLS